MSWLIRRLAPRSWTIWLLYSFSLLKFVSIICTVGFLKISPALFSTKILKNAYEPIGATVPREPLVGSLAFFILVLNKGGPVKEITLYHTNHHQYKEHNRHDDHQCEIQWEICGVSYGGGGG